MSAGRGRSWVADDAQVAVFASGLRGVGGRSRFGPLSTRVGMVGGFPDRIGDGQKVVAAALGRRLPGVEADELPVHRWGQLRRMVGAQVVGARLGSSAQRADDDGRISV